MGGPVVFTCRLSQRQGNTCAPSCPFADPNLPGWGGYALFGHEIPGHGKEAVAQCGGYPGLHQGGPGPGQGPVSLVASKFCPILPATNLSVCKQADPPRLYLITRFSSSSELK